MTTNKENYNATGPCLNKKLRMKAEELNILLQMA